MVTADRLPLEQLEGGRYQTVDLLRDTPDVQTFHARDLGSGGRDVVVRVAPEARFPKTELRRMRLCVDALEATTCPSIPPTLAVGIEHDHLFSVRPHYPGDSLDARLVDGPLPVREALDVAQIVVQALMHALARGVSHENLRPSNIMLDLGAPDPVVRVTDFCGPRPRLPRARADQRGPIISTVGSILFHCLAGRSLDGPTRTAFLARQASLPLPGLDAAGLPIAQLDATVRWMLQPHHADELQSLAVALAELDRLVEVQEDAVANAGPAIFAKPQPCPALIDPTSAGQASVPDGLAKLVERTRSGRGEVVFLEAAAGSGKTAILNRLSCDAAQEGCLVIRGQALPLPERGPVQVLTSLVTDLADKAATMPELRAHLRGVLEVDDRVSKGSTAPLLGLLRGASEPSGSAAGVPGSVELARQRQKALVHSSLAVLDALGSPEMPCLVLVDDGHWADEFSRQVLTEWIERRHRTPASASRHVSIVAAFDPEGMNDAYDSFAAPGVSRIHLSPLDQRELRDLVHSMGGPVSEELVRVVRARSGGNPFRAAEATRALHDSGAAVHTANGWTLATGNQVSDRDEPPDGDPLVERLSLLSSHAMRVLAAGAVLGMSFRAAQAAELADVDEEEAALALHESARRGFIWISDDSSCTFRHELTRAAILAQVPSGALSLAHAGAAAVLRRGHDDAVPGGMHGRQLVFHLAAAGRSHQALAEARVAGEEMSAACDLELAEAYFRIAEQGAPASDAPVRFEIAMALGGIMMLRGSHADAERQLDEAYALASCDVDRARVEAERAELEFRQRRVRDAGQRSESALRLLGERVPRSLLGLLIGIARESAIQRLRTLRSRLPGERRRRNARLASLHDVARLTLLSQLYGRLLYAWFFDHGRIATAWVQLRQLNVAQRAGRQASGQAYALHGVIRALLFPPLWRSALRSVDRGAAVHRERGDIRGMSRAWSSRAAVLHAAARYSEALECCSRAIELLESIGDRWERHGPPWHRALCLYRIGDLDRAVEQGQTLYRAGLANGDLQFEGFGLEIWAKASGGAVPGELIEDALARAGELGDIHTMASLLQANGLHLIHQGRPVEAAEVLATADSLLRTHRISGVYHASITTWIATAHRQAAQRHGRPDAEGQQLAAQAHKSARRAVRRARIYRNDLPHALREAGWAATLRGKPRRARRLFERSIRVATKQGARAERDDSINARYCSIVGGGQAAAAGPSALGGPLARASSPAADLPFVPNLMSRRSALVEVGRQLAGTATPVELTRALEEGCASLFDADKVVVSLAAVPVDHAGGQAVEGREGIPMLDLHEMSLQRGRPIVLANRREVITQLADVHLPGVDSGLFGLIQGSGGEVMGSVLVIDRRPERLFGSEERRLLEFVAAVVGSVIERQRLQLDMRTRILAAEEAERGRIAYDLHDSLGQVLTSILYDLQYMQAAVPSDGPELSAVRERIEATRGLASGAIEQVRRLAYELRPAVLDDNGLADAVRLLASEMRKRHQIDLNVFVSESCEDRRFPSVLETAVYRVSQEALTNVARHARCESCSILLTLIDDRLRLVVEDDGVGFDAGAVDDKRLGLRGMRERAELISGSLKVSTRPASGTTVILEASVA